jgi:hypothetical protein
MRADEGILCAWTFACRDGQMRLAVVLHAPAARLRQLCDILRLATVLALIVTLLTIGVCSADVA